MKTHLFSYRYEGADWCLEIKADNKEDAVRRVSQLVYAKYDGELLAQIPASSGVLLRPFVFVRNLLHNIFIPEGDKSR